ncbi:hypothetical protein GSI_06304 [Ganoderma sinense ZZ0214-1]|uniref:Uncharacterized protein n=1 Tax=Ganoderma sinense ZZ0214-1 TaxID=1077348 RepID=A0A2G8SCX0_9APHY|nr:hypothetical protein GSI_06304 [Ganoderma sinense ZZ0214-1]
MFSSWRHTVESLSQPPKQDASSPNGDEAPVRSSIDGVRSSLSSSSHLAESALSSLRKSLAAQRPASPGANHARTTSASSPVAEPAPISSPAPSPKPRTAGRSTLEDRLRAKFAIGDASNSSTPTASARTSPSPVPTAEHPLAIFPSVSQDQDAPVVKGPPNPLSPTSTPLPDSPLQSPVVDGANSLETLPPTDVNPLILSMQSGSSSSAEEQVSQSLLSPVEVPPAEVVQVVEAPSALETGSLEETPVLATSPPANENVIQLSSQSAPSPSSGELHAVDDDFSSDTSTRHVDAPADTPSETPSAPYISVDDPHAKITVNEVNGDASSDPTNAVNDEYPSPLTPIEDASTTGSETVQHGAPNGKSSDGVDVEALQKRLKLVEQRFTDVSTSFKRLQAEKVAADRVLRELTSVESVTEVDVLRDFLQNMNFKMEMAQDEIRRLNGKLTRQEERIEELRDIHRLEVKSQIDQIDQLKGQVEEAEKLLKASQGSTAQVEQESAKRKAEIEKLHSELDKAKNEAKEEEEKRTKAIALLKTVRQKLVKAEKERDDATKEVGTLKEVEKAEREKEKAERARLQGEIEKVNVEREMAIQGLRAQFDKEVAAAKERFDKELAALRGQYELEAITTKTTHVREIEHKKSRIADLENTVKTLSAEKDELFDQVQLRQAETESSQSHLESLQGQNTELQYQLREANDRIQLLQEEFSDVRREQEIKGAPSGPSAEEVTRILVAAESKHEMKLDDLRRRLAEAERERDEGEARWSKTVKERAREVESLKAAINSSQRSKEAETEEAQALEQEIESLKGEIQSYQTQLKDLLAQLEKAAEVEATVKDQLAEISAKTGDLQQFVDEGKNRETQLRNQNKAGGLLVMVAYLC